MNLQCWKCGTPLKDVLLPFSRYEECSACKADQHVCRMCKEYDPSVADACREDRADFVLDKEKANFCDFFKARPGAYRPADDSSARQARARLAELFGEQSQETAAGQSDAPQSEADRAMVELKRLFGDD